ncbi:MAG: glutamine-hydrolyzing GMP synthase, partial [Nitrospirota bacterium]
MEKDYRDKILILDFGAQYTQLIARRVREGKVYSEIFSFNVPVERIKAFSPKGIILSGSPASVYDKDAPICNPEVFKLGIPVLGICYGMQLITHLLGGRVAKAMKREYGRAELIIDDDSDIFKDLKTQDSRLKTIVVWMSHGDRIEKQPEGFTPIAHTGSSPVAAMKDRSRKFYAVQFHPEVVHTPEGTKILQNFIYDICGCRPTWTMASFIDSSVRSIKEMV